MHVMSHDSLPSFLRICYEFQVLFLHKRLDIFDALENNKASEMSVKNITIIISRITIKISSERRDKESIRITLG